MTARRTLGAPLFGSQRFSPFLPVSTQSQPTPPLLLGAAGIPTHRLTPITGPSASPNA